MIILLEKDSNIKKRYYVEFSAKGSTEIRSDGVIKKSQKLDGSYVIITGKYLMCTSEVW